VRKTLQQHQQFRSRYTLPAEEAELGRGRYGIVLRAGCQASGAAVAVKVHAVEETEESLRCFRNEILHLKHLKHGNIIELIEAFDEPTHKCMVLEYCDGGDLLLHVNTNGPLEAQEARREMAALLSAVRHCHGRRVAHRDLKPENLLLKRGRPGCLQVADFETATYFHSSGHLRENVGTVGYASPQMAQGSYTKACDCWSCGVVCYFMLSCRLPFERVTRGDYDFPESAWAGIPKDVRRLIAGLLDYAEGTRLTASGALQCSGLVSYSV